MPNNLSSVGVLRPATINGFSGGYTTGFDLVANVGPTDGVPVVTLQAIARPTAFLLGPGLAALLTQLNTYYGGGKAAAILTAAGVAAPTPGDGIWWLILRENLVSYQVAAADLNAQVAALLATLATGGNVQKGANP